MMENVINCGTCLTDKEIKKITIEIEKQKKKEQNRILNEAPKRPLLEEIGNSITHGVGAIFGVVVLILMLLKSTTTLEIIGSLVYGISMILMMLMSCLYHAFKHGSRVKRLWRRFDYASIYLLIGGTYAPLFLIYLGNSLGLILFVVQWTFIIIGITFVSIFGPGKIKWLHYLLYFLVGWSGVLFIPMWIGTENTLLFWILLGGVIYTLGMIPFLKKDVKNAHFVWHFFVLFGAIAHFIGIYLSLYL